MPAALTALLLLAHLLAALVAGPLPLRAAVADALTTTYDALHRVTGVDHQGAAAERYAYDAVGNPLSTTSGATTWTCSPSTFSQPAGRSSAATSEAWAWDPQGRLTPRTATTGAATDTWSYAYDGAGRLVRVTSPSGATTNRYDVDDGLVKEAHATGSVYRHGGWRLDTRGADRELVSPLPMLSLDRVVGSSPSLPREAAPEARPAGDDLHAALDPGQRDDPEVQVTARRESPSNATRWDHDGRG